MSKYKDALGEVFAEFERKQRKEVYDAFKGIAAMMHEQKMAFVDAGFTDSQAMEIIIEDYLDNKRVNKEEN
ncbi:hypothetical protein [Bacillus toyonensis]|uniref:hypothetical protein n=1 Tax=Bacillus toyonensis TaxID=155322 RepID=UPI000BF11D13|nr:hypothetical protein [Bacillus toyonensis]PEM64413.1 hypothetical protein CN625_01495 [Bacillus toyonensis]